jgi:CHAT domain-containing protein
MRVLTALMLVALAAQGPPAPRLAAGTIVEADLKGGEVHVYDVDLAAGTFLAVHFDQRGIDIRPVILGPDGTVLFDYDAREWGTEPASIIAPAAGRYRLEARPLEKAAPRGHYVLTVDALRPATSTDEAQARVTALQVQAYAALQARSPADVARARGLYQLALDGWHALGNGLGEADATTALGFIANWTDDLPAAIDYSTRDVALRRAIGDEYGEARALAALGVDLRVRGDVAAADTAFEQALALHRAAGRAANAADVLGKLSITARWRGDYGAALQRAYEAITIGRDLNDPAREAEGLINVGPVHLDLGELDAALDAYRRVRQLRPEDETWRALTASQMGLALTRKGEFDAALPLLQEGLAVWTQRGWRAYEANTLRYMGELFVARGEEQAALDAFLRASVKSAESGYAMGAALAQRQAGEILLRLGRLDEAERAFDAGDAEFIREDDSVAHAFVLADRARLALARRDLALAHQRAEQAIDIIESTRGRAESMRIRTGILASSQTLYEAFVDVLMAEHANRPSGGFDARAFEISERARARSLLELVMDERAPASGPTAPGTLSHARDLHRQINAKARALDDARRVKNAPLAASLAHDLEQLTDRYGFLEDEIRRDKSGAAAQPLSLADVQRSVVDDDTVLVEYLLGDTGSYAWVVSRNGIKGHRLAPRRDLEEAARLARTAVAGRGPAADALGRLAELLIKPLGAIPGRRILIVAPGALQQIPFGALPVGGAPLIARYEVIHAPSASIVGALRIANAGRRRAPRAVAVFADPVFDAGDPRVSPRAAPPVVHGTAATTRGVPDDLTRAGLGRLPFTRMEADAITALAPRNAAWQATDFDASLQAVERPALADYRIVHFATHGVLDTRTPELSGLVFSLVTRQGRRQDGLLRLHDLGRLHLNADLVVLSGCDTALGRTVEGEGVVGLTRGFTLAGARAVVASLWKVDDRATAELMKRFYLEMLQNKLRPAAALAAAQRQMAATAEWASPYYWAGLAMQGEWR